MFNKNPYTWLGLGLLITGSLVSVSAYFILNLIWLTAMGICTLILSIIVIALGKTIPKLSPEVCSMLLETGIDNIATIVEELGIKSKAIYLPSSLTGGRPQALIPLHSNSSVPQITKAVPQRFITRYGIGPDDVGLLISTIGSNAFSMLDSTPLPTPASLEASLTALFTGTLGVADRTRVVCRENHIRVGIRNPRIDNRDTWSHQCLGYPLASIVASIAAEAWNKPVTIKHEETLNKEYSVELEVID
ncbi:hypothetical protein ACFLUB_03765 [Chloroflexota bacterium]